MPQIRVKMGFQQGSVFPLEDKKMLIGRDPQSDILLDLESPASRHHATLYKVANQWRIQDQGSTNGTLLNGSRIEDSALRNGDKIVIGTAIFVYEDTAPAPAPASTPAKSEKTPEEVLPVSGEEQSRIQETVREMSVKTRLIEAEISKAIIGQKEIIVELLTAIIADGHVLMIGMPGLAKTMMIRTVSEVLDLKFRRIQFTPDLMPSDITGTDILEMDENTGRKEYRFIKGPIFTNMLLADEINRTPPKTQAALLEAMQEHRVTAAGETYPLDLPFFVLATQNPLEQEGTYPLPEAQLDRFMFSIYVDYPTEADEEMIAKVTTTQRNVELKKILNAAEILELQKVVRDLPISNHVVKYATRLVRATRPSDVRAPDFIKKWIHCGAGPRAAQYLVLAAKARAVIKGRLLVSCDDVRAAARPVLRHRIFTNFTADSENVDTDKIVQKLLEAIPEPDEKDY
ncbi:MAG: AAA family ATPase [Chthoniobacteraceae bacterium]